MKFDARAKMDEIAQQIGGYPQLRMEMRNAGFMEWNTAKFYPVVAWFPEYMDEPDVVGIAIRHGYSFSILYGRTITPHEKVNKWFDYVSLHDNYNSITEALLDHHKAIIATEIDFAEIDNGKTWTDLVQEVIDGIRPTKYDINDDDFLIDSIDVINFSDAETWLSEHESFRVLFNALKNLGVGDINSSSFESSKSEEKDLVLFSGDKFDEEFQNEWA